MKCRLLISVFLEDLKNAKDEDGPSTSVVLKKMIDGLPEGTLKAVNSKYRLIFFISDIQYLIFGHE